MLLRIQTIQLPQDNQCWWDEKWKMVLICGYGDACHSCLVAANHRRICGWNHFQITRGGWWSRRCCVAPCDLWRLNVKMKKERVCSQWDVYALREQWSKTSSLNSKSEPPWSHTQTLLLSNPSTNTTSTLYTHSFMHTHSHTELLVAEWHLLSRYTSSRMAFVVVIENLWFSLWISWRI